VEIKPGRSIKGVVIIDAAMDQDTFRPRTKTGRIRILPLQPRGQGSIAEDPGRDGYVFQFKNKPFNRKTHQSNLAPPCPGRVTQLSFYPFYYQKINPFSYKNNFGLQRSQLCLPR